MTPVIAARRDPSLVARVVDRRPILYRAGADDRLDRPAHVRAASGVAWVGDRLAVIQDDANFLALVDPADGVANAITLAAGAGGVRLFDDARGNKRFKLDLEAVAAVAGADPSLLLAFGSGSTGARERVLVVRAAETAHPVIRLVGVPRFYEALRANRDFAGAELNVEGAIQFGDTVRLFGRGNGASRGASGPVNASGELSLRALLAHVEDRDTEPPALQRVTQYDLGAIDEVPLGFTDAVLVTEDDAGTVLFTAAAEASPDATRDGEVVGSAIGVIRNGGDAPGAWWIELCDERGDGIRVKIEGIALDRTVPGRLWLVADADDPARPSELLTVELSGDWLV